MVLLAPMETQHKLGPNWSPLLSLNSAPDNSSWHQHTGKSWVDPTWVFVPDRCDMFTMRPRCRLKHVLNHATVTDRDAGGFLTKLSIFMFLFISPLAFLIFSTSFTVGLQQKVPPRMSLVLLKKVKKVVFPMPSDHFSRQEFLIFHKSQPCVC